VEARPYPARVAPCRPPGGLDNRAVCRAQDTGVALVMTRLHITAMNLLPCRTQTSRRAPHVLMDKVDWHTTGHTHVRAGSRIIAIARPLAVVLGRDLATRANSRAAAERDLNHPVAPRSRPTRPAPSYRPRSDASTTSCHCRRLSMLRRRLLVSTKPVLDTSIPI
jgi:hypothetical protein